MCHINDIAESLLGKTLDRSKDTGKTKAYLCALNVKWFSFDFTTQKKFLIEPKDEVPKQTL
jgi:type I restriction enzyme S subunit